MAPNEKGKDKDRQATAEEESPPASTSGQEASGEHSGEHSGETSGGLVPSTQRIGQGTSRIPGFSNDQVNGLMSLFSGMLDQKLQQHFGQHQEQHPVPSIEYPSHSASVPPPKLGEKQEDQPQQFQQQEQYYNDVAVKRLRAEDVGFFDPEYVDEKTSSGNSRTVNAGKHVIYRDVYTFVDRLKHLAHSHSSTAVVAIISECLRGGVLAWHNDELTDFEKSGLRTVSCGARLIRARVNVIIPPI